MRVLYLYSVALTKESGLSGVKGGMYLIMLQKSAPIKVMIWGCIGIFGVGPITVVMETLTGENYKALLSRQLPKLKSKVKKHWVFQQDNSKAHKAGLVTQYLKKKK